MSHQINHIILHSIHVAGEGQIESHIREQELDASVAVEHMAEELHNIYATKGGKGFACFKSEGDDFRPEFEPALRALLAQEINFVGFSQRATRLLVDELKKYSFAESGVLAFIHYTYVASDYLLIALLENRSSVTVSERLDLTSVHYLDLDKLQLAARLDLTQLERDPESNRYPSFIKVRVGRKVADFFLDFLGAEEGMDAKVQNSTLVQAVEEFCDTAQLDRGEKQQVRQQLSGYCSEQISAGEEIQLKDVADQLKDVADQDFYSFADSAYDLEDSFPADRATVRKLTKFVGQGGGVSLSFDQKLLGERIQYDPESDTLTLSGTPPNLREQLKKFFSVDN